MKNFFFSVPSEELKATPIEQRRQIIFEPISREVERAVPFLGEHWKMQDNKSDKLTNKIVYNAQTFREVEECYQKHPLGSFNYLAHRWYNKTTSTMTEDIFCSYSIARKEENIKHKTIDFYLMNVPFDLKLTSFPKKFGKQRSDYSSDRSYRNDLIRWLYDNQSKGNRNHEKNRIFVVCKHEQGLNSKNNLLLKKDFDQINSKVKTFLDYSNKRYQKGEEPFNKVTLNSGKTVYSEIIFIY